MPEVRETDSAHSCSEQPEKADKQPGAEVEAAGD